LYSLHTRHTGKALVVLEKKYPKNKKAANVGCGIRL
jgi:hypothetical protein